MQHFYEMLFLYFTGPWLNFISKISQNVDYNLSSVCIHCAILLSLACLSNFARKLYYFFNKNEQLKRPTIITSLLILLLNIAYLLYSAASQNSITPYLAPSYYRVPLKQKLDAKSTQVPQSFITWRDAHAIKTLKEQFDWNEYINLSNQAIIVDANLRISEISQSFGYTTGPPVSKIKILSGIPRILGYAYGGPAYYDSTTHEIVLPEPEDYPASRYFFISTIYHEISHALVFQNEIDASLIQYLAMRSSQFRTIRALAEFMWLEYSSRASWSILLTKLESNEVNAQFLEEIRKSRIQVSSRMSNLPLVRSIQNIMQSLNFYNSSQKYGITPHQFSNSTFYQVVYQLEGDTWIKQSNSIE